MSILTQIRLPMRTGVYIVRASTSTLSMCIMFLCIRKNKKNICKYQFNENAFAFTCYFIKGIYKLEKKLAWLEIRTSPAHLVVQPTNHWVTEHVRIAHRSFMFYMKTVSVRMYTFHKCENYVKVSHDCPTKRDGSSFKTFVMQQSSRNIKVSTV